MPMTKKNFEAAAELVRVRDGAEARAAMEAFVELFRDDNPRFDVERFKKACVSHRTSGPQNGLSGRSDRRIPTENLAWASRAGSYPWETGGRPQMQETVKESIARIRKETRDVKKCPPGKRRTASGACKRPKRS